MEFFLVPIEAHREARNSSKSQDLGRGSEFFLSPPDIFSKGHFSNVTSSRGRRWGKVSKIRFFGGEGGRREQRHETCQKLRPSPPALATMVLKGDSNACFKILTPVRSSSFSTSMVSSTPDGLWDLIQLSPLLVTPLACPP